MLYSQPYTDPQGNVRSMPAFGGPLGGLPGGPRSFATPQYSGQEGNYNATIRELLKAGVSPEDIKKYGPQIAGGKMSAQDFLASEKNRVTGGAGGGGRAPVTGTNQRPPVDPSRNLLMDRNQLLGGALSNRNLGRYATYGPMAVDAVQDIAQGRPVEGIGGLAVGGGTAALMRSAGRTVGGRFGTALQIAAPFVGLGASEVAGGQLQSMYQRSTGKGDPTELSTQLGQTEKVAELLAKMDERTARTYIDTQNQLGRNAAELDLNILERQQPIIEQAQRNALVRQQALINTMGQNYAMLGTVATAGKLALGSQQEAGANLRTALQANPYSNAVLSAPSISF